MSFLQWQQTDKTQFAVFIRDLTKHLNNVKHMVEDSMKQPEKPKYHKKGKKLVKKKKDIIIEQQTKLRLDKHLKEDLSKLNYLLDNINYENPYLSFKQMKTEQGLLQLKFKILEHLWSFKKTYFPHVMNLYFQLINKDTTESDKAILNDIGKRLEDTEYKLYMMKNLSHLLPPLNIHEPNVKKLDEWQIQVVNYIKKKESVVVKAPTSSGKSFVGLSAGILHKKLLYVCPAEPIAYQVGAHFSMMGYKVHYLLDNLCHVSYDEKTNIFVGVPRVVEDQLYKIGVSFDYAVFDEIHNLNKQDDGYMYENIIKLIQCPFLALSATIGNIEFLVDICKKIHNKEVHYIEYTKRFINQQKMIYDGSLQTLHPLACIDYENLNENFLHQNLQFTPYDSAILWETMEEVFDQKDYSDDFEEMIENCSPDNYFDDDHKILTLDDTRNYEQFIKTKMVELAKSHPDEIKQILCKFQKNYSILQPSNKIKDIICMFQECKKNDCLPMLVFHTDTQLCKQLFTELFTEIANSELEDYPFHYDILEQKDELYTKYKEKRSQFIESMKIGKTNDARTEKQTKTDRFDKNAERQYITDVISYYETCIHNCARSGVSPEIKHKQIKHLTKEMKEYIKYPSFGSIDIFQKHKDFCFSNTDPMTGDQIRDIRREIKKTLGIKLSYEHELFQMLKRGIGIYTEDMPEEYRWILQKLMDEKKIGIVISDRTLCLGIDLPIRSSCLLGLPGSKEFTIDDYLQMSGRAGRRGKDDRGNTIFYNLDYKRLMRGVLPNIVGSEIGIPGNYQSLKKSIDTEIVDNVYKNSINSYKRSLDPIFRETSIPKLQWLLRYQENVPLFIDEIDRWNKGVYQAVTDVDKELCVLMRILSLGNIDLQLIDVYKKKVIDSEFHQFKYICRLIEIVYNTLKDKKYTHMKEVMKRVHGLCKDMILNYQGLH